MGRNTSALLSLWLGPPKKAVTLAQKLRLTLLRRTAGGCQLTPRGAAGQSPFLKAHGVSDKMQKENWEQTPGITYIIKSRSLSAFEALTIQQNVYELIISLEGISRLDTPGSSSKPSWCAGGCLACLLLWGFPHPDQ